MSNAQTTTRSQVKQLSNGNPNGTILGKSASDLIAFFGATPVVRQTTVTALVTSSPVSTYDAGGYSSWGFSTSTQVATLMAGYNQFKTALDALGLLG